jgi:hypothetical protein
MNQHWTDKECDCSDDEEWLGPKCAERHRQSVIIYNACYHDVLMESPYPLEGLHTCLLCGYSAPLRGWENAAKCRGL